MEVSTEVPTFASKETPCLNTSSLCMGILRSCTSSTKLYLVTPGIAPTTVLLLLLLSCCWFYRVLPQHRHGAADDNNKHVHLLPPLPLLPRAPSTVRRVTPQGHPGGRAPGRDGSIVWSLCVCVRRVDGFGGGRSVCARSPRFTVRADAVPMTHDGCFWRRTIYLLIN